MNAYFGGEIPSLPSDRYYDANGFLRIRLRFMRTGLLKYSPDAENFPAGVPEGAIGPDGMVTVMVEPEDLGDPESLASLTGIDCLPSHVVISPESPQKIIGNVAGLPEFDGTYVTGEAVIKDKATIEQIELPDGDPNKLIEDSACYRHVVEWVPDPYVNKPYAGRQKKIRYNHFVLLPKGKGRAGPEVCIMNSKDEKMSDKPDGLVACYLRNKGVVYAKNESDAERILKEDAIAENEDNPTPPESDRSAEFEGLMSQLEALRAERDELDALVKELQASLAGANSEEVIEEKAEEISREREEIATAMNAADVMDKETAIKTLREKQLRGVQARIFAMNSIREKKGRPLIDQKYMNNPDAINGMWEIAKEAIPQVSSVPASSLIPQGMAFNGMDGRSFAQARREKTLMDLGMMKKGN